MTDAWKKLYAGIALFITLFATFPAAMAFNASINCASTNIPTAYATTSPSLALNKVSTPYRAAIMVINNTSGRICFNTVSANNVAPTAGDGNEHCVIASTAAAYDNINTPTIWSSVYVRGDGASCTSGTVDIDLW